MKPKEINKNRRPLAVGRSCRRVGDQPRKDRSICRKIEMANPGVVFQCEPVTCHRRPNPDRVVGDVLLIGVALTQEEFGLIRNNLAWHQGLNGEPDRCRHARPLFRIHIYIRERGGIGKLNGANERAS